MSTLLNTRQTFPYNNLANHRVSVAQCLRFRTWNSRSEVDSQLYTQNYSLCHALDMMKKRKFLHIIFLRSNSPLTSDTKLTYYFDLIM